ncbi:MAG: flagellar motor switch protein FliG [Gemmatimonadota bacterium]
MSDGSATVRRDRLTGLQKSAVLCMIVGSDAAAKILQRLGAEEVEAISREIATLHSVGADHVLAVLTEFREVAAAVESVAQGGRDYARQLLEQALGPARARAIFERIEAQMADTGLKRLRKAAPDVLANILRGEHPQTIALILAHLDVRQGAGLIEAMDPEIAGDVLYRVARMDKISPDILALVEAGLSSKTDLSLSQEMTLSGGPSAVAKMLNLLGGTSEKMLLEAIQLRNAELAAEIKNLMFVFEDLKLLDSKSMQRVLRDVDMKDLTLGLKAASEELKRHILSNMSERAATTLQEELEFLGAVRVKDVEAAHSRIIEVVRTLEEAGEIVVRGRGGDDDIIA